MNDECVRVGANTEKTSMSYSDCTGRWGKAPLPTPHSRLHPHPHPRVLYRGHIIGVYTYKCSYNGHIDDFIDPCSVLGLGVFFWVGGFGGITGGGGRRGGGGGGGHPASGDTHFVWVAGAGGLLYLS